MIIETFLICALTTVAPYYDCGEMWEINMHDTKYLSKILCDSESDFVIGCAMYSSNDFINKIKPPRIHLGLDTRYIDEFGQNNLQHEVRHVQCRCNFHE
jgi:hypothetical protein